MDYAKTAQTALENSYMFLDMVERNRKSSHGVGEPIEVAPAKAHVEQLLWRVWARESVPHDEVHRALQMVAHDVGQVCLAAEDKGFMREIASQVVSHSATVVERQRMIGEGFPGVPEVIPSLRDRVFDQMGELVKRHCMDDPDAQVVLDGMASVQHMDGLREIAQRHPGEAARNTKPLTFGGINESNMDGLIVDIWVSGVGKSHGLPSALVIEPVIREAKLTGALCPEAAEQMRHDWERDRPEVDPEWIAMASRVLCKAAVSETLMEGEQPAERLANLLARASERQPSVAGQYQALRDTYVVGDRLDAVSSQVTATSEALADVTRELERIRSAVGRPYQLSDLVTPEQQETLSDQDRARIDAVFEAQDRMIEQLADIPAQLEGLADTIRNAQDYEPDDGPALR